MTYLEVNFFSAMFFAILDPLPSANFIFVLTPQLLDPRIIINLRVLLINYIANKIA